MGSNDFSAYRADGSPVVQVANTGDLASYRADGSPVVQLAGNSISASRNVPVAWAGALSAPRACPWSSTLPMMFVSRAVPMAWITKTGRGAEVPMAWTRPSQFPRSFPLAVAGTFLAIRQCPVAWLSALTSFERVCPLSTTEKVSTTQPLPMAWSPPPPLQCARQFSIVTVGRLSVSHVIPIGWRLPMALSCERALPLSTRTLAVFLRQLPVGWSAQQIDEWTILTSPQGDSWAVAPGTAAPDVWTVVTPPEPDVWS